MTKGFEDLLNKEKNQLTPDELMIVLRLCQIKKNENSIWTDIVLLASPLVIILGFINLFVPIFVNTFDIILNYLATIPAFLNIAIKIREIAKKKSFMKEFGISKKEMKEILKSDQIKVFEELIQDIKNGNFNLNVTKNTDRTFEEFEFKEPELSIDLTDAKSRVKEEHRKPLIKRIIKKTKNKSANASEKDIDTKSL